MKSSKFFSRRTTPLHASLASRIAIAAGACFLAGCRAPGRLPSVSAPRETPPAAVQQAAPAPAATAVQRLPSVPADKPASPVRLVGFQGQPGPATPSAANIEAPATDRVARAQDRATPGKELPMLAEPVRTPPPAEGDPLAGKQVFTLADLEQMALTSNPTLPEARARVEAARGRWVQVGLPPNTVVGYSGQQLASAGQAEQQGIFVEQEFIRGGKLRLNRNVIAQEVQRAENEWASQQLRVLTDVRICFYQVLVAQRRLEVLSQLVRIAREAEDSANALLQAKEASRLDLSRAIIERQRTELRQKTARNELQAAWTRLEAVLGVRQLSACTVAGDLDGFDREMCIDDAFARVLAESPQLAAAVSNVQRARWAIDRAYAEPVPDIDVQAIFQSDNATGSANGNLQVTFPIPWLNRNQGGIAQAQAELVVAQRAVNRLQQGLRWRLAEVYQKYSSAQNQVRDYSRPGGIIENEANVLSLMRRAYLAGENSYLDLLSVQQDNAEVNLLYVEALGDLCEAALEIDGLLLRDSLQSLDLDDLESAP